MWNIKTNSDLVRFLYRYAFDEMRMGARDFVRERDMTEFAIREAEAMVDLNPAWNIDDETRRRRVAIIVSNLMRVYYEHHAKWHPNCDHIPF